MIKVIIFDVDGVLVNAERFTETLAREHGISTGRTAPFFKGPFNECLVGKADLKEIIPPYLSEWGWAGSVDDFLEYWFASEHVTNKELVDYVQSIRAQGIRCVVATNNEKHRTNYLLSDMGFSNSFDKLYSSADLQHKKPAGEFYSAVLRDLNVAKNEVLFFDDTRENIAAAKEFGINAELYTTFNDFENTLRRHRSGRRDLIRRISGRVLAGIIVILFAGTVILRPEAWFGRDAGLSWTSFAAFVLLMIAFTTYAVAGEGPANRILRFLEDAYKLPGRLFDRFISINDGDVKFRWRNVRTLDVDAPASPIARNVNYELPPAANDPTVQPVDTGLPH